MAEQFQVVTNDGGALSGQLSPEIVEFSLSDGGSGSIQLDEVARIVPKRGKPIDPKDLNKWFRFDKPVFVYKNEDRIAGELQSESMEIHTSIGKIDVAMDSLRSIELNTGDNVNMATFVTTDGQTFTGVFYDQLSVKVWGDKIIKIAPTNLSTIFLMGGNVEAFSAEIPVNKSILKLSDAEFLFATIRSDEKPLEFRTAFGTRTIDPEQIKNLVYIPSLAGEMRIELWDGSELTGKLTADHILFDILGHDMEILPSMVVEFNNPIALPPESLRQKYVDLIKELGSPKFKIRQAAFEKLEKDADKINGLLDSHLEGANAETKSRLLKLLGP